MKIPSPFTDLFLRVFVLVFMAALVMACGSNTQAPSEVAKLPEPSASAPGPSPSTPTPFPSKNSPPPTESPGQATSTLQPETEVSSAQAETSPVPPGETHESPSDTPTLFGSIQGNVTIGSSGSSPASGASITVAGRPDLATKTNGDGFYALMDLQPGEYTLRASTSEASSSFQVVQVVAGETTSVDFVLIGGVPIITISVAPTSKGGIQGRVTLRGLDGVDRPAEGAAVEVAGWPSLATNTDQDGRYAILDLQPGQYYLIARTTSTVSSYMPVQVTAGVTGVADFLILKIIPGPPPTIQAKVSVHLNGQPVARAYMWIEGTKQVFLTNKKGVAKLTYRYNDGRPVIAVFKDRWGFAQVPRNGDVNIELAQQGTPPPLPKGYIIVTPTPGAPVPTNPFQIVTPLPPVVAPGKVPPSPTPTAPLLKLPLFTAKP